MATVLLGAVGCGAERAVEDDGVEMEIDDLKADGLGSLVGRWQRSSAVLGELRSLALGADKTFAATFQRACLGIDCDREQGTFKVTKSTTGKTKYLRLSRDGSLLARYAFTIGSTSLSLRDTTTQKSFVMVPDALATEGSACRSFGNPTLPDCEAGLVCEPGPIPDTAHCVKPRAGLGEYCKSFGNPTLPECEPGLVCERGPDLDTAHCVAELHSDTGGAKKGEYCKSFGNPTLPECEPGLVCQLGPELDAAHCV